MTTRWITLAAALCAAVGLAGCTDTSSGSPMPKYTVEDTTAPDTSDSTSSTEPSSERPREIRLDGKDPCLIPQSDWPRFHIERPGQVSENPNFKSPNCNYSGSYAGAVTLVITEGIEAWTEETRNAEIEDAEPIDGFPTLLIANNVDKRACYAAMDVADGQYLLTTATPNPDDPAQPKKCDLAYDLAVSAMKTLVAS